MSREAIITITPDNPEKEMDIQTGEVTTLEMLDYLKAIQKHLATKLCDEYKEYSGNSSMEGFDDYIKFLRNSKL